MSGTPDQRDGPNQTHGNPRPGLTYEEQLAEQRGRARMLVDKCGVPELTLVRVDYKDLPPRVSILGHAILPCMADIWRSRGATVTEIEKVTPCPPGGSPDPFSRHFRGSDFS